MEESSHPDSSRFPVLTVLLVLGSLLIFLSPVISSYLLYDRTLILSGQVWRVATGVLVHFSWSHLAYNSIILVLAGWLIERNSRFTLTWLVLLTAVLGSFYFVLFMPEMKQFGGLSGVVSATVAYLCMVNISARSRDKWLWIIILGLLIAKIIFEIVTQETVFASYSSAGIRVVPEAHIIGLLVAMILMVVPLKNNKKR